MYKRLPKPKSQIHEDFSSESHEIASVDHLPCPEFLREAIFAAGRFWELEAAFGCLEGVVRTAVGYFGGDLIKPSYKEVSEGKTGHTEAVKVTYDKRRISYRSLCKAFWASHDPTNKDFLRFGIETHYRSAIFYGDEDERKAARETKVKQQMKLNKRIVTKIVPCSRPTNNDLVFYIAESRHHKYYLQMDHIGLCESLNLRSAEQFADSHLACKLNGLFGGDGKDKLQDLKDFMERYDLLMPDKTKLILEVILQASAAEKTLELEE
ncbi:peptide methionine sulfoxide reductase-like isoform X1 [Ananas comosus]|uniref:peptide-methionine (S)-S-oxide reductase n=1 Tax=Ananas comosus TaxID=4615 RepID=A0A6P5FVM7_ANACO|nr:peptide methionine sulfoxide reductase-like isoform X1 [Ananas comosus]